ncbi:MAG: hypothetical protein JXQ66_02500 [Campylobacterales bacterium]|nr:hypothetical protein [Campylobacterales bacterium]
MEISPTNFNTPQTSLERDMQHPKKQVELQSANDGYSVVSTDVQTSSKETLLDKQKIEEKTTVEKTVSQKEEAYQLDLTV